MQKKASPEVVLLSVITTLDVSTRPWFLVAVESSFSSCGMGGTHGTDKATVITLLFLPHSMVTILFDSDHTKSRFKPLPCGNNSEPRGLPC